MSTVREAAIIHWLDELANWDVFFTGTTRYPAAAYSLKKSFESFMRRHYRSISYVYTCEPHKNHGFHVHAMFDQPYELRWKTFWRRWFDQYGRADTTPIRHKANVESYVTKYVCKAWDYENEQQVGDPWRDPNHKNAIWWNVKLAHQRELRAA